MRCSIVNCVSTAEKMMRFSDESLFRNAGHDDFDYIVVKWLASPGVEAYLEELPDIAAQYCPQCKVHVLTHETDESIGYVPNLRAMMNEGFTYGFVLNNYAGLVNTDVYFGPGWLAGLERYVEPSLVVNSLHITAVPVRMMDYPLLGIVNEDLGVPEPETFNLARFNELYQQYREDRIVRANELKRKGGYRNCATMPYLFHWSLWDQCGPWETTLNNDPTRAPDRRFFDRMHDAGADFALSYASIIYHHEAVERKGKRPPGTEHMPAE